MVPRRPHLRVGPLAVVGATVVVTSRHHSKRRRLSALGFEYVFDALDADYIDQGTDVPGGRRATLIVDNVGEPLI